MGHQNRAGGNRCASLCLGSCRWSLGSCACGWAPRDLVPPCPHLLAWPLRSRHPCDLRCTCAELPFILESQGNSPGLSTQSFSSTGFHLSLTHCTHLGSSCWGFFSPAHSLGITDILTGISDFSRFGAHSKRILCFSFWCFDLWFQAEVGAVYKAWAALDVGGT